MKPSLMALIGNDVVDLGDPESDPESLHPRFDERVFAASERASLAVAAAPNRERWRRWAAKEAAYKLARKRSPRTIFSPSRFVTEIDADGARGNVSHAAGRFDIRFFEDGDALHAIATLEGETPRELAFAARTSDAPVDDSDPQAQSGAVRDLLCSQLAERLRVAREDLEIRRVSRVPVLWLRGEPCTIDVSLSHHGRFVAFACGWNELCAAEAPATAIRRGPAPGGAAG